MKGKFRMGYYYRKSGILLKEVMLKYFAYRLLCTVWDAFKKTIS